MNQSPPRKNSVVATAEKEDWMNETTVVAAAAAAGADDATSKDAPAEAITHLDTPRKRKRSGKNVPFLNDKKGIQGGEEGVDQNDSKESFNDDVTGLTDDVTGLTMEEENVDKKEREEEEPVEKVEDDIPSDFDEIEKEHFHASSKDYWANLDKLGVQSFNSLKPTGSAAEDDDFATKCKEVLKLWREALADKKDSQMKLPHDKDDLLQKLEKAISDYLSIKEKMQDGQYLTPEEIIETLDEEDKKMYKFMVDKGERSMAQHILNKAQRSKVKAQRSKVKAQRSKVLLCCAEVNTYVSQVSYRTLDIHRILSSLSCLSQAEGTTTISKQNGSTERQTAKSDRNTNNDHDSEAHYLPQKIDVPSMKSIDFEETSPFFRASLHDVNIPLRAQKVIAVFENAMRKGKFLKRYQKTKKTNKEDKSKNDEEASENKDAESANLTLDQYKIEIQNTVTKLRTLLDEVIDHPDVNIDNLEIESQLAFPGPTCQEVEGVHPIWTLLLEYIGKCHAMDSAEQPAVSSAIEAAADDVNIPRPSSYPHNTPNKIQKLKQEVKVEGTKNRKRRSCDLVVWKIGRYLFVMRDDASMLCIELKPGQRTYSNVLQMINEYEDQDCSHMSKSVAVGFNFAGVGVDTHATSLGGTLCFVSLYQLQLAQSGTPDAELSLKSTGVMPLFSSDVFDRWYNSDSPKTDAASRAISDVRKRLYPDSADHRSLENVQLGFKALWKLFGMSHSSLFGPEWNNVSPRLGKLLGSGTFGSVYEYNKSENTDYDDAVVKVSRFGRRKDIQKEVRVLRYLSDKQQEAHDHILRYRSHGFLQIEIGDVTMKMPAVISSPRGLPLLSQIKRKGIMEVVANGMESATNRLKLLGICHNDICFKNIVVIPDEKNWRAVLIDFSVASLAEEKLTGFYGTVPFIHRKVQKYESRKEWWPHQYFDLAALGFTMAFIAAGTGSCPWTGFSGKPVKDNKQLDYRVTVALGEIEKAECDEETKEKCKKWIKLDTTKITNLNKDTGNKESGIDWTEKEVVFTDLL